MKSTLTYERLARGEVQQELTAIDIQVLDKMSVEDRAFLEQFPVSMLENSLKSKRRSRRRAFQAGLGGSILAAAALVLCLPFLAHQPEETTRVKSVDTSLLVYHKTATGTELLSPRAVLGENDEVQLAYFSARKQYGAILSVDGRGTVTIHLPLNSSQAIEIETQQPELLPYSYKLDDAPNFEAVFFITSNHPFQVSALRPFLKAFALQNLSTLALPDGFSAVEFLITKKESSR